MVEFGFIVMLTVIVVAVSLAQKYYDDVQRLKDVIEYMVEDEIDD